MDSRPRVSSSGRVPDMPGTRPPQASLVGGGLFLHAGLFGALGRLGLVRLGLRGAALQFLELLGQFLLPGAPALRMMREAGTGRDQAPDDDVLLQPPQIVLQAPHRGLGEDASGLLEGGGGDERLGGQRRLGDAEQQRLVAERLLALDLHLLDGLQRAREVDLLPAQVAGLARIADDHLAQHLADDHLDVLVVDLHALQAVDVLDLAHQVVGQRLYALQAQDIVGVGLAVRDDLAALDLLALEDVQVAPLRNQLLVALALLVGDDQAALALGLLAEADRAGVFGQDRRLLGLASLEQVGHAGQTAGDVAGLGGLLGDTGDDVADGNGVAVTHVDDGARRQRIHSRDIRVGEVDLFTVLVHQFRERTQVAAGAATLLRVGHHRAGEAGHLVHLLGDRDALDEVLELDGAGHLADHGVGMGIPCRHDLAVLVHDGELARTGDGHQIALLVMHGLDVAEPRHALGLDLDAVHGGGTGGRTADVERAHRELRARLADGLGGYHADRLADIDAVTARQVASVALRAHAVAGLAGDGRAHLDVVDGQLLEQLHAGLVQQGAGIQRHLVGAGDHDRLGHHPAQHALAQGLDDVAAFHQRDHVDAVASAAVVPRDHQVLGDVHQPAGEITRVGRLQRRIGQALAGAVGGDEVLQYVQTLAEVRGDG